MIGILGKKLGMTQIFAEGGKIVPVTVIEAGPCCVVQVKTLEKDGYEAVKVGFNEIKKEKKVNKALSGVFKKQGSSRTGCLRNLLWETLRLETLSLLKSLTRETMFLLQAFLRARVFRELLRGINLQAGLLLTVLRFTVRRAHRSKFLSFESMEKSEDARTYGPERVTAKNLTVVDVKPDQNILMIRGAVPGAPGAYVMIRKES